MFFIEGFIIGLGMIVFVGPVFFLLLNSSFQYGTKAGFLVALGIICSDIVCVTLCYYGIGAFITSQNQFWIGVIGSLIVFGLGVNYLFKKVVIRNEVSEKITGKLVSLFIKGFSVNFFNPFVFVVWIGVCKYGQERYDNNVSILLFLTAVLLGILTTDLLKVVLSEKIKKFISQKRLKVFFRVTGIVLLFFSFRIIYLIWC